MNERLQEDELLALEAIYGENLSHIERVRKMQALEISIHCEAPNGITFTADFEHGENSKSTTTAGRDVYVFKVQHLPPVVLTCLLPLSYPSRLPPYFSLHVPWLDTVRIGNLCHMLDMIWTEQQGHEVIYQWVEWLHSFSLPYLGCEKEMTLGPYVPSNHGDERAITGIHSPERDV